MKIVKIILIINFLLFSACGFKPVSNFYDYNFKIINLEFTGNKLINKNINRNFLKFTNKKKASRFYKIKINSNLIKSVTSKDSTGKEASYSVEVNLSVDIFENDKKIASNLFSKKTNYNNLNSKFELKQYENVLVKNLTDQIILDLNNFIGSIK